MTASQSRVAAKRKHVCRNAAHMLVIFSSELLLFSVEIMHHFSDSHAHVLLPLCTHKQTFSPFNHAGQAGWGDQWEPHGRCNVCSALTGPSRAEGPQEFTLHQKEQRYVPEQTVVPVDFCFSIVSRENCISTFSMLAYVMANSFRFCRNINTVLWLTGHFTGNSLLIDSSLHYLGSPLIDHIDSLPTHPGHFSETPTTSVHVVELPSSLHQC